MLTFVVFIISLVLIAFLFMQKSFEISYGKKVLLEETFLKCDIGIHNILLKIKYWWSHVNFKNTRLVFMWVMVNVRRILLNTKKRFDHKQSQFFIKRDYKAPKSRGSVSFFLKDVSDYKKSLREGREGK
jgi:hypothetical protein